MGLIISVAGTVVHVRAKERQSSHKAGAGGDVLSNNQTRSKTSGTITLEGATVGQSYSALYFIICELNLLFTETGDGGLAANGHGGRAGNALVNNT